MRSWVIPAIKNTLPVICRKRHQFYRKTQFVLLELDLISNIDQAHLINNAGRMLASNHQLPHFQWTFLWTRYCAENRVVPKRLPTCKFSEYRRRIWTGKFMIHMSTETARSFHYQVHCSDTPYVCVWLVGSSRVWGGGSWWGSLSFVVAAEFTCSWHLALCSGHLLLRMLP